MSHHLASETMTPEASPAGSPPGQPRRRRDLRRLAVAGAAAGGLAVTGLTGLAAPASATVDGSYTQVGPNGGGYTSVIASNGNGVLIAGGDSSGLFRSVDGGASWKAVNAGISVNYVPNATTGDTYASTTERMKVAAVTYVPNAAGSGQGRWYAAVGNGASGTVLASTDQGQSWVSMVHTTPAFAGANAARLGLASRHPRATGNLLAADASGSYLYAGSFETGVWRCRLNSTFPLDCSDTSDGSWTRIGLLPKDGDSVVHYVRSIALNPSSSVPRLIVSTIDVNTALGSSAVGTPAVYLADNPSSATAASWKPITGVPSEPVEELKYIKTVTGSTRQVLYAVGKSGIYRINSESLGVVPGLVPVQTSAVPGDASTSIGWTGLDGLATSTGSRIVVTTGIALTGGVNRRTAVLDVTESGSSFTASALTGIDNDSTGKPKLNTTMLGGGTWDLQTSRPLALLGQKEFLGSYVLVEPVASGTPRLWVAGKQGIYRNTWTTGTFGNWDVSAAGLTNTFTYGMVQAPVGTDRSVAWPDADLITERTTSTLLAAKRCSPPESGTGQMINGTAAYGLKYQTDGTAWLATADQDGWNYGSGQLWRGTLNGTTCSWTLEQNFVTAVGNKKIAAFDVTGSGSTTVLTAYVPGKGFVRGTGTPSAGLTWTSLGANGSLPIFPAVDPTTSTGTAVSEATKGVSLITVNDKIVLARPAVDATGLQGGVFVCSPDPTAPQTKVRCKTTSLWSQSFNYLELDPKRYGRVLWSAAPTAVPASAKVDPNTVTTGKAGVWAVDTGTSDGSVVLTQLSPYIGGPMTVVRESSGRAMLVVVLGHAALPKITISRLDLLAVDGPWELIQAGPGLANAGVDATGVVVTKDGPSAGTWRIYISTLGGGVMSADLTSW